MRRVPSKSSWTFMIRWSSSKSGKPSSNSSASGSPKWKLPAEICIAALSFTAALLTMLNTYSGMS